MAATFRRYRPDVDTARVSAFLARTWSVAKPCLNWLRARWEYMIYSIEGGEERALAPFGVWESGDEIVGLANLEQTPGEVFLQVHPEHTTIQAAMLRYAEEALYANEGEQRRLTVYVNERDRELEALARETGYVRGSGEVQVTSWLDLTARSRAVTLVEGFVLTDRRACNDLRAINRVLWRGFNHPGPPPEEHVAGRADVERAPLYRPELVVMAQAPGGDLVSYCGVWFEAATQVAYVEPVATDPDYRRRGLGSAVVGEALRRAKALGATRAIVGSGLPFYQALGFEPLYASYPWHKTWSCEPVGGAG